VFHALELDARADFCSTPFRVVARGVKMRHCDSTLHPR
jgi:hypothetical protein